VSVPNVPRYSEEEAIAFAEERERKILVSDEGAGDKRVVFGDIWREKRSFTLLALEEGFLETWTRGRFVCIGDSVHKVSYFYFMRIIRYYAKT